MEFSYHLFSAERCLNKFAAAPIGLRIGHTAEDKNQSRQFFLDLFQIFPNCFIHKGQLRSIKLEVDSLTFIKTGANDDLILAEAFLEY